MGGKSYKEEVFCHENSQTATVKGCRISILRDMQNLQIIMSNLILLEQEAGLDDLWRSFATYVILWFKDLIFFFDV